MNYEELLSTCDVLIKAGKIGEVEEPLLALNFTSVPRKWLHAIAKLCRRAGLIEQGLRLLQPLIRNELSLNEPPTSQEVCEYAVLLSRNGSILEALKLLQGIKILEAPESILYEGFCHVSGWNYSKAAACFEKYLQSSDDSYTKLIARVNLVAAYIATRQLEAADKLLNEAIDDAKSAGANRLVGNCFELAGQVAFFKGNFENARRELDRASKVFAQSGSYDELLIYKWRSTMQAMEEKSIEPLMRFRAHAVKKKHWESVRDTDFYRLKVSFDQNIFDHLIFGTPSEYYRERVLREIPQVPSAFINYGGTEEPDFDLQTGRMKRSGPVIAGKKIHQVLNTLLKDFYAPLTVGSLFSEIYPEDYFDIDSSPLRVRQTLRRTRRWLELSEIPATIDESRGHYKLNFSASFVIRISLGRVSASTFEIQWQKIQELFPAGAAFSAEEAGLKLQISRTSFHRWLTWALDSNLVEKSGVNKATLYRIISNSSLKV